MRPSPRLLAIRAAIMFVFIVTVQFLEWERGVFTSLVTHVERGQNLVAALPPSPLLSRADRDGIIRHSGWRWD